MSAKTKENTKKCSKRIFHNCYDYFYNAYEEVLLNCQELRNYKTWHNEDSNIYNNCNVSGDVINSFLDVLELLELDDDQKLSICAGLVSNNLFEYCRNLRFSDDNVYYAVVFEEYYNQHILQVDNTKQEQFKSSIKNFIQDYKISHEIISKTHTYMQFLIFEYPLKDKNKVEVIDNLKRIYRLIVELSDPSNQKNGENQYRNKTLKELVNWFGRSLSITRFTGSNSKLLENLYYCIPIRSQNALTNHTIIELLPLKYSIFENYKEQIIDNPKGYCNNFLEKLKEFDELDQFITRCCVAIDFFNQSDQNTIIKLYQKKFKTKVKEFLVSVRQNGEKMVNFNTAMETEVDKELLERLKDKMNDISIFQRNMIKYISTKEVYQNLDAVIFLYSYQLKKKDLSTYNTILGHLVSLKQNKPNEEIIVYDLDIRKDIESYSNFNKMELLVRTNSQGIKQYNGILIEKHVNDKEENKDKDKILLSTSTQTKKNDMLSLTSQFSTLNIQDNLSVEKAEPSKSQIKPINSNKDKMLLSKSTQTEQNDNRLDKEAKNINILLLGESGSGKSTFINAIHNYLKFSSLDAANEQKDISYLIHSEFVVIDKYVKPHSIKIGSPDKNECFIPGQSSTQTSKAYTFTIDDTLYRIIDTPGIGDTRGIEQDKKNFKNIVEFISKYDHLNAICFLVKPNESPLQPKFKYCFKELFSNLNKKATKNIIFCFTNCRSTQYTPGDTLMVLREFLNEINQISKVEIPNTKKNIFCFDNEAFRYLALTKENIQMKNLDKESYAMSWNNSSDESIRMLKYIKEDLSIMNTHEIVLLNESKCLLMDWSKDAVESLKWILSCLSEIGQSNINNETQSKYSTFLNKLKDNILNNCVKLSSYVRQNAIAVFNDQFEVYLGQSISDEEKLQYQEGYDSLILKELKITKKTYRESCLSYNFDKEIIDKEKIEAIKNELVNDLRLCKD